MQEYLDLCTQKDISVTRFKTFHNFLVSKVVVDIATCCIRLTLKSEWLPCL